jgi:hypothetical protein
MVRNSSLNLPKHVLDCTVTVTVWGLSCSCSHLLATTHRSELRPTRLALFTVTHLDKLSIASAIQPQFNPSILPAHAPLLCCKVQYCRNTVTWETLSATPLVRRCRFSVGLVFLKAASYVAVNAVKQISCGAAQQRQILYCYVCTVVVLWCCGYLTRSHRSSLFTRRISYVMYTRSARTTHVEHRICYNGRQPSHTSVLVRLRFCVETSCCINVNSWIIALSRTACSLPRIRLSSQNRAGYYFNAFDTVVAIQYRSLSILSNFNVSGSLVCSCSCLTGKVIMEALVTDRPDRS